MLLQVNYFLDGNAEMQHNMEQSVGALELERIEPKIWMITNSVPLGKILSICLMK